MSMTKKNILLSLAVTALAGGAVFLWQVYNILNTFTTTTETATIPIVIEVDSTVVPDVVVQDMPSTEAVSWGDTLTDMGDGTLQDSDGNVYTIDGDGNIIDSQGNTMDDGTGDILIPATGN